MGDGARDRLGGDRRLGPKAGCSAAALREERRVGSRTMVDGWWVSGEEGGCETSRRKQGVGAGRVGGDR